MAAGVPEAATSDRRRFARWLVAVVAGAFVWRVGYTLGFTAHVEHSIYDALYYVLQSEAVVNGKGFVRPLTSLANADHPPLTTLAIAPATWLFGVSSDTAVQRLTMCVVGSGTVAGIGLLAREVRGWRVGLVAAFIAAIYPNLFMNDGVVMAESLAALLVTFALYFAFRVRVGATTRAVVGLGVCCGLAALARAELILLVPFVVVPIVLGGTRAEWRSRIRPLASVVAIAVVVIAPWVVRNLVAFEEPALLSTGDGLVLLGANCDEVYQGSRLGFWSVDCGLAVSDGPDAAIQSRRQRTAAFDYIGDHLGRVPTVVAARVGRVWGVFRPVQTVEFSEVEGRPAAAGYAGLVMYWVLVPFAIAGVVVLRRQRRLLWPLLVPFGIVTLVAALSYGIIRFRVPAEPSLVVLAAVALDARWRRRSAAPGEAAVDDQSSAIDASSSS